MASALITLVATIAAGLLSNTSPPDLKTVLDAATPNISEFATLLTSPTYSSLFKDLSSRKGFHITVLAPDNAAFAKIPGSSLASAFESNDTRVIRDLLRYHVLHEDVPIESINGTVAHSWLNDTAVTGGQVVGTAQDGPVGVFTSAPGERSSVLTADLPFEGGILHVVDSFLVPPPGLIPKTAAASDLTAFVGAIVHASLNDTITDAKDVTIFAPSNAAFAAIGASLDGMSVPDLAKLLKYHIVNTDTYTLKGNSHPFSIGYAASMPNGTVLQTLESSNISITHGTNSPLFINSAHVVQADILLENGVVHIIDDVLDPNVADIKPDTSRATSAPSPIISGSSLDNGKVPFTQFFPKEAPSSSTVAPAAAKSFGVYDIGSGAKGTGGGAHGRDLQARATGDAAGEVSMSASQTSDGAASTAAVTSAGVRVQMGEVGLIAGVVVVLLGVLV